MYGNYISENSPETKVVWFIYDRKCPTHFSCLQVVNKKLVSVSNMYTIDHCYPCISLLGSS